MDPVRSSLLGGLAATAVLAGVLAGIDLVVTGSETFAVAAFTAPCALVGAPYCSVGGTAATALTAGWFLALFALAWPLLFAGFTWGIPGETGTAHGAIFGFVLAAGYLARGLSAYGPEARTVVVVVLGYVVYGVVLGTVYDRLAAHRTLLDAGDDSVE